MAVAFGVQPPAIYEARKRFGLPSRKGGRRLPKVVVTGRDRSEAEAVIERLADRRAAGEIPVPPDWPLERDLAVLGTGGRYAEIRRLSWEFGMSFQRVLARWHVVRAV